MSQRAHDALQAVLAKQRAEIHMILCERLVAQAMCVVLNARPVFQSSKIEVDHDDIAELRKVLVEMGVDLNV